MLFEWLLCFQYGGGFCHLSSCAALLWKYFHVMVMAKTETEGAMYYYYNYYTQSSVSVLFTFRYSVLCVIPSVACCQGNGLCEEKLMDQFMAIFRKYFAEFVVPNFDTVVTHRISRARRYVKVLSGVLALNFGQFMKGILIY